MVKLKLILFEAIYSRRVDAIFDDSSQNLWHSALSVSSQWGISLISWGTHGRSCSWRFASRCTPSFVPPCSFFLVSFSKESRTPQSTRCCGWELHGRENTYNKVLKVLLVWIKKPFYNRKRQRKKPKAYQRIEKRSLVDKKKFISVSLNYGNYSSLLKILKWTHATPPPSPTSQVNHHTPKAPFLSELQATGILYLQA